MDTGMTRRDFVKATALVGAASAMLPSAMATAEDARPPVVVALVGCAHIHTPSFVGKLAKSPLVKVKYVWDPLAERAQKNATTLGAKAVASADEIWADADVKAVVICSQTNEHHNLVLAAAKAGKHMFVEKPLGVSSKESIEMADAIEKAGVLFTTGYFMRSDPVNLYLKELVDKGTFGKITRVHGSNCHNGSLKGYFDTDYRWMADPKLAGVGAYGDLGTHSLDILMWLMGDVESVTAEVRAVTHRYGDCDESGEGLIHFKNGVLGVLSAGWLDLADPLRLMISGTEGHAAVINNQLFLTCPKIQGADGKKPWTELPKGQSHAFDLFLDAVSGKKDVPLVPVRQAAARVIVMEAMYQAARDKKWVTIG